MKVYGAVRMTIYILTTQIGPTGNGKYPAPISTGTRDILPKIFRSFAQLCQENSGIVPEIAHILSSSSFIC
jgi:hypothetical protein